MPLRHNEDVHKQEKDVFSLHQSTRNHSSLKGLLHKEIHVVLPHRSKEIHVERGEHQSFTI